ncbi:MAG TPA: glutamate-1-semialdehyde 2,1-aminomutase [Solirubrobacteraceae bacterium]|nr:glutamate-1-semialdehyde 2,1-aminomutase [Solirubrobacteraceae bacterium]
MSAVNDRARKVLPGGVNSPVRAMRQIGREPIFIERGEGSELVDVEGNRYIDWVCSWGPLILGHADPAVVSAVIEAAKRGTSYGAATAIEVRLAEEVAARMPSVEMLRMTSSGTEAAMSAVRLARALTGREVVVKFAGAYHGHSDGLLAEGGSGMATLSVPGSPGVPPAMAALTVVVPWNDRAAVEAALAEHEVAALLVEPVAANMGVVPAADGFLEFLREATRAAGTQLIFDEVITGFRVARGGAQELYGIEPDLTVLGKIIGGGLPAAAFAGPAESMERIAPAGDVYQAGTLSGNPLAVAAALATLQHLDTAAYESLAETTEALAEGMREAARGNGVAVQVQSLPGLLTIFFSERPVTNYAGAAACDTDAFAQWCRALLARGVYPPPSQFEAWFPSLVHGREHVMRTVTAAAEAFAELSQ